MSEPFRPNHMIPGTNYRYLSVLGEGGQGVVVLAADDFLQTQVVIKLVHASHAQYLSTRIRDEARTLAGISHPCIVPVIGGGMTAEATPRPYFVMKRLEGDTLYAVMKRRGQAFAMRNAIDIVIDLLEALDIAHNPPHSLLHRDIKPANIFMQRISPHETRPVLLDFGLALLFELGSKQTGRRFVGTLEYASPEQLRGEPLTPRSDIYNIALVLFELCAGRHVFSYCGKDRNAYINAHLYDAPVRLSSLGIDMDPALDQIVFSALNKDPNERPRSAHEFARALKAIRTSLDISRGRPALDAKTDEEPFETLWARMGVTPTTSATSHPPLSPVADMVFASPKIERGKVETDLALAPTAPGNETKYVSPPSEKNATPVPPTASVENPLVIPSMAKREAYRLAAPRPAAGMDARADRRTRPRFVLPRNLAKSVARVVMLIALTFSTGVLLLALYAHLSKATPPPSSDRSAPTQVRIAPTVPPAETTTPPSVLAVASMTGVRPSRSAIATAPTTMPTPRTTATTRRDPDIMRSTTIVKSAPLATTTTKAKLPGSGLDDPTPSTKTPPPHLDLLSDKP